MRNKFDEDHILSICKPGDYIVTPPMKAQITVDELRRYYLGEDWYDDSGVTDTEQVNTNIVAEIEQKYKGVKIGLFKRKSFDPDHIWNLCDSKDWNCPIFSPPMRAEVAIRELGDYFLGDKWYGRFGDEYMNTIIVSDIEKRYKGCRIKKGKKGEKS